MSLRPGLGAPAMAVVNEAIHCEGGSGLVALEGGDVPYELRLGQIKVPLGRYLRARLRHEVGMPQRLIEEAKNRFSLEKSGEVCALLQAALLLDQSGAVTSKSVVVEAEKVRVQQIEARSKLNNRRSI